MKRIEIPYQKASEMAFTPYGTFVSAETREADSAGDELSFWNKLSVLDHPGNTSISIVRTYGKHGLEEHTLEQHTATGEALIPTEDIIVVVALSSAEDQKKIDLSSVKAFSVPKGSAVHLHKGVWHHAPLTRADVCDTFVLFYENTPDEDFFAYDLDIDLGLYYAVVEG